jgi:hypothetical protein
VQLTICDCALVQRAPFVPDGAARAVQDSVNKGALAVRAARWRITTPPTMKREAAELTNFECAVRTPLAALAEGRAVVPRALVESTGFRKPHRHVRAAEHTVLEGTLVLNQL